MRHTLEKEIKALLKRNQSKQAIYKTLATDTNQNELTNLLNNLPLNSRRKITFGITLFLVGLLSLLTIKQSLFVYLHSNTAASLILGFVGPIIHIYIIRELLSSLMESQKFFICFVAANFVLLHLHEEPPWKMNK